MLFVLAAVAVALVRVQTYRPARTLLLAIAPLLLYSFVELVSTLLSNRFLKRLQQRFENSQGFAIIWLGTFVLIAPQPEKAPRKGTPGARGR